MHTSQFRDAGRSASETAGAKSGRNEGAGKARGVWSLLFCMVPGLALSALALSGPAFAIGAPVDRAVGFQEPASEIAEAQIFLHNSILFPIITVVAVLVLALLVYVMLRFRRSAHPTPRNFSHNTAVEVIWTVVPVVILVFISLFSFPVLFREGIAPKNIGETVKVRGNQWSWTYIYPDASGDLSNGFEFTSSLLPDEDIDTAKGQKRQLSVDYPLVVPAGENILVLVTADRVIHSFGVPALGIKTDAVPGKTSETWFNIRQPGTYYGVCYELCGLRHGYMPIEIRALSRPDYNRWRAAASANVDAGLSILAAVSGPVQAGPVRVAASQ